MLISRFETDEGITILRLSGKLIASTLENLKASLDTVLADEPPKILLNFKQVAVLDSFAVGLLVSRHKAAGRKKGFFGFCELDPALKSILNHGDPEKTFDIYEKEKEGIASIREDLKNRE